MTEPAQRCIHCGARFDAHIPASNGGFDCPPRADGTVLRIVAAGTIAGLWPHDDETSWERREWVDPEPQDAIEALHMAHSRAKPRAAATEAVDSKALNPSAAAQGEETKRCTKCGALFEPAAWQIRHSRYRCWPCLADHDRKRKRAAAAAGRGWQPKDPERERRRHKAYRLRPEALAREKERARLLRQTADPVRLTKERARRMAMAAVKNGTLMRSPCEVCGATNAQGHHEDYAKPLEVRWLCPVHHTARHRELRRKVS